MIDYLLSRLLNELDLHFRLQKVFQEGNKNRFEYMNTKRYDLFSDYVFYCNLHDKEIKIKDFNLILDFITLELTTKGYISEYDTDKDLLIIKQC